MVFRKFHWGIFFRLLLLTGGLLLFSFCVTNGFYLRAIYVAFFSGLIIAELYHFLTKFTTNVKTMLVGLQHGDHSLHFEKVGAPLQDLYDEMNRVVVAFRKVSREKEAQYLFLEKLVEHVKIGIICLDDRGNIYMVNNSFRQQLGLRPFDKLTLDTIHAEVAGVLQSISAGETRSVSTELGGRRITLTIYASAFKLQGRMFKLISVQDITRQLDAKELEAWMKLMRVLTHEIMNSISPIVSLSETLKAIASDMDKNERNDALVAGLHAIQVRSKGLKDFAESYRQLSRIPEPVLAETGMNELMQLIQPLIHEEVRKKNVEIIVDVEDVRINIDTNLFSHALLNLIQNSFDALDGIPEPRIEIKGKWFDGNYLISVSDNGNGIASADIDKVFVPFFTTKKNGSGIGLAVVRQIVQLHGGKITVNSIAQKTTFTITL